MQTKTQVQTVAAPGQTYLGSQTNQTWIWLIRGLETTRECQMVGWIGKQIKLSLTNIVNYPKNNLPTVDPKVLFPKGKWTFLVYSFENVLFLILGCEVKTFYEKNPKKVQLPFGKSTRGATITWMMKNLHRPPEFLDREVAVYKFNK